MTTQEKQQIRKIQSILQSIDNGTPKFFNVTQYKNLGLVTIKKKWGYDSSGNKVEMGYTFHLTPKAKIYLNVAV
jgi:hypothetical protein